MSRPAERRRVLPEICRALGFSVGAGLLSAVVLMLIVLLLPQAASAAGDTGLAALPAVKIQDVHSGTLLLRSGGVLRGAPTVKTDVDIRVSGVIARAKVVQHFRNPGKHWVEGVYAFPLPANAAVDHLRMRIGDRVIEGEVKERRQARRVYRQARRAGKKASLLEQQRPNLFTASVANIGPGQEVTIEIDYQQTLRYDAGRFHLRFPMVVAPRYIPGVPTENVARFSGTGWAANTNQVPDASKITPPVVPPGRGPVNPVSLRVELDAGFPLAAVKSPYHKVKIAQEGEGRVLVTLADGTVPADRDFELVWRPVPGHAPRAALFTEPDDNSLYSLIMVMPPTADTEQQTHLPREVIFVIDTSGSMGGPSIRQARQALNLALDRLRPGDRFNVIQFNSYTQKLFQTAQPADSTHVALAHQFVNALQADGGTEMAGALTAALDGRDDHQRVRQVVFLTDGAVGNEPALFDLIKRRLGDSRLFTVGIGSAPNAYFMRKAAQYGRGSFTYIGSVGEVRAKMQALFTKLETPVMSHLRLTWPDGCKAEVWPRRLPDLYAGQPLVVVAKTDRRPGSVVVSGLRGQQPWRAKLVLKGGRVGAGVGVLWARSKIAALMDSLHDGANPQEVRKAVIHVALQHHLVSKYTSLVAVDVTPSRPQAASLQRHAVPTDLPLGWQYAKVFGRLPQTGTAAELDLLIGMLVLLLAGFLYVLHRLT